jgi:1-acyl-sn-glycerol-3-phosphate acyltransferase
MRTAWNYALLVAGIVLFTAICFTWAVVSTILWPLLPARTGRRVGRVGAMLCFRGFLGAMELLGAWRLDLRALDALASAGPLILAPNHPGLLDAVLLISRVPNAVCVMKRSLLRHFGLAPASRLARYLPNDSLLRLVTGAAEEFRHGGQLLLFPEGTRTVGPPLGPLTQAAGAISRCTQVPVQMVIIEMSAPLLCKGGRWFARPPLPVRLHVRLGRRLDPPQDVRAFTEELERQFRRELSAGALAAAEAAAAPVVGSAPPLRG